MRFKKFHLPTLFLLLTGFIFTSCEDYNDLELQAPDGDADFSTVVAVGNSLTAGYQSNALYETGQKYSFPALVAGQIETVQDFEQPLISDPGMGGRIGLDAESVSTPIPTEEQGTPLNANLDRPYNNLGIPGAILADFLGQDLPGNSYDQRRENNPLFEVILRDFGATQAEQMAQLDPTFVMFGLGNNDVLGYVTSGGNAPYVPADNFEQFYTASMQQVAETGADAVVYNIPDVTSLPYVFLTNLQMLQEEVITDREIVNGNLNEEFQGPYYSFITPDEQFLPIWIETTNPSAPGEVQDTVQMSTPSPAIPHPGSFFILPAGSQLPDLFAGGTGLDPSNPIPHELVLDDGEMRQAMALIVQYNLIIESQAGSNGFTVVDINNTFSDIIGQFQATGEGYQADGIELQPIPGELFSLDGVHPSNRGSGVMANETIETINSAYNTDIPTIDLSAIPQGIPITN